MTETIDTVTLLFPGQGAQQDGMAVGLYTEDEHFRGHVDEVFELWGAEGARIRRDWLSDSPEIPLDDLRRAQPLLFAVGWALGRTVLDWGVRPAALLGHSVGEVVAATLAGVFDLADAARLMADRVEAIADTPPGGMLGVAASRAEIEPYLGPDVALAAVNAPRQVMIAGLQAPLDDAAARLGRDGFTCRRVRTFTAFHSPAIAPAAHRCAAGFDAITLNPPRLRLFSAYAGGLMTDALATDREFWLGQPSATGFFWPALDALLAEGDTVLVEAGAGQSLTSLARRHRAVAGGGTESIALLPARAGRDHRDGEAVRAVRDRLSVQDDALSGAS